MINVMQIDTQTIVDLIPFLNMIWSAPLQIVICVVMLWKYLQLASLTSIGVIILSIPINALVTKGTFSVSKEKLVVQDKRIKLTNEVLNGAKVIKLFGWELSFQDMIEKLRKVEMNLLKKKYIYFAIFTFIAGGLSFFVNKTLIELTSYYT